MNLYDRILGGLYGQALGDAWGMPACMHPDDTWKRYGGWVERLLDAPDDHPVHGGLKAGQVTDDTEQAFALAEAIIADGKVTVEGAARAIVGWYDAIDGDNTPYVGPSTRRAVLALKSGADPRTTGLHGDTNGGAMKISPVGLIHPGDVEGVVPDVVAACTPTHFTDVAVSGAAAVAGAIARALAEDAFLPDIVAAGMQAADLGRSHGNRWMGPSIPRRIDLAVSIAGSPDSERRRIGDLYDIIGCTLATTEAVPAAFGVLVMAEGDVIRSATYATALSGDADTVAAMACAIAGAWKGASSFPPEHLETIRNANPALDFERVAKELARLAG